MIKLSVHLRWTTIKWWASAVLDSSFIVSRSSSRVCWADRPSAGKTNSQQSFVSDSICMWERELALKQKDTNIVAWTFNCTLISSQPESLTAWNAVAVMWMTPSPPIDRCMFPDWWTLQFGFLRMFWAEVDTRCELDSAANTSICTPNHSGFYR